MKCGFYRDNNLEEFLRSQDCEYNLPGILNFILYCIDTRIDDINLYGGSSIKKKIMTFLLNIGFSYERYMIDSMKKYDFDVEKREEGVYYIDGRRLVTYS